MSDTNTPSPMKVRSAMNKQGSAAFRKYKDLCHGDASLLSVIVSELLTLMIGSVPGALGLFLRKQLYPSLLGSCGNNVVFGRGITLRHAQKVIVGSNVIFDDNCVIDAKGSTNSGISIGDNVYIGRNTIICCKNGNISLEKGVNISSNCTVFSANKVTIKADTMIGAYTYLLSGGEYEFGPGSPKFVDQDGARTKGALSVGPNTWLGARVTVLDGASIGEHCVIGACSLVNKPIPPNSLAFGAPAKVAKSI